MIKVAGQHVCDLVCQLLRRAVGEVGENDLIKTLGLRPDRSGDFRVGMTVVVDPPRRDTIEKFAPIGEVIEGAFRLSDFEGLGVDDDDDDDDDNGDGEEVSRGDMEASCGLLTLVLLST